MKSKKPDKKGLRMMVVCEGRAAAGKGGTIKAITERVSPRVFRLPAGRFTPIRAEGLLALG
jgi:polyphosphate kinase 2 (PPK2 family)